MIIVVIAGSEHCENVKLSHFGKKTWHFGKIMAFGENHGFRVS